MAVEYQRGGDLIEITIRDNSGAKLEHFVCPLNDKKKYSKILKYLKDKYGAEIEVDSFERIKGIDFWGDEI